MNSLDSLVGALVALLVLLGLFMAVRRVLLWYWNLSAIEQRLREQSETMRELHQAQIATNIVLRAMLNSLPPQQQPPES